MSDATRKDRVFAWEPAVESLYGWSGAGDRWVTYLREVESWGHPRHGQSLVVAEHSSEAEAMADADARNFTENVMFVSARSAWARDLAAYDFSEGFVDDDNLVPSSALSSDWYAYEPDEVVDSVSASQLARRSGAAVASFVPAEYGDDLPYSPGAMPDRLSVAFRPQRVDRTVEEEREWIRAAQSGDNDAMVRLLEAYSVILTKRRDAIAAASGKPRSHVESMLLYGFTFAVMSFDTEQASRSARLAGGASGSRALRFFLADADLQEGALSSLPVEVNLRVFQELLAMLANSNSSWRMEPDLLPRDSRFISMTDLSILADIRMAHRLVNNDTDDDDLDVDDRPGTELSLHEAVSQAEVERTASMIARDLSDVALSGLDSEQRALMRALLGFDGEPVSQAEYAERIGMTQQAVSLRYQKALVSMRESLGIRESK